MTSKNSYNSTTDTLVAEVTQLQLTNVDLDRRYAQLKEEHEKVLAECERLHKELEKSRRGENQPDTSGHCGPRMFHKK
jgi:hypothetical protein